MTLTSCLSREFGINERASVLHGPFTTCANTFTISLLTPVAAKTLLTGPYRYLKTVGSEAVIGHGENNRVIAYQGLD